jgi:hypothetical protein
LKKKSQLSPVSESTTTRARGKKPEQKKERKQNLKITTNIKNSKKEEERIGNKQ